MEIDSPRSRAGESEFIVVRWSCPASESHGPMEMSVAMKRTVFLLALLLAVPVLAAGQSQTRERTANDSETTRTGSTAVRDRVVGASRAANHVEKQQTKVGTNDQTAKSGPARNSSNPENQRVNQNAPKWGNSPVISRSGGNEPIVPLQTAPADKQPATKLVQQTSLRVEAPASSPVKSNATSPKPLASRGTPTVYQVGIGDVLDIRLTNLPTRESTLFTVLRSGLLEYPLLSGPLSVAGMTTDEIAKLLSNEIKVIKAARVSVSVRDYASHVVVVTGLVDSPGRKTMRREAMPLFAVLAEALPRPEASQAIIVRGGNSQTVSLSNEPAMATLVLPGDTIKVSGADNSSARFVYVGGEVVSRGEKEYRTGMTLTQAILSAGGVTRGSKASVRVARREANGFLKSNDYNLQSIEEGKSQDPLLAPGDRIEVTRGM